MVSGTGKLVVRVSYGDSLNDEIHSVMEDELRVAQNKWKINLKNEEKDIIRKKAVFQLAEKMSEAYKVSVSHRGLKQEIPSSQMTASIKGYEDMYRPEGMVLDLSEVYVMIRSKFHSENIKIALNPQSTEDIGILVLRTSAGYIVSEESTEKTLWLTELPQHIKQSLHKWTRTAVFYGVGSLC